jgi:sulfur transfer protein SufE
MAATTSTSTEGKLPDKFEPVAEVQRRYRKVVNFGFFYQHRPTTNAK